MHRSAVILSAVAVAAAFGLGACGADREETPGASESPSESVVEAPPPIVPAPAPVVPAEPLPPPTALSDVMNRIADAAVPGAEKTALIESAAPSDAAAMDKFGVALRQAGYDPVSFEARDLRWVQGSTERVSALVTLKTENPQAGDFTYPMEFTLSGGSWQLARRTADELLGEDSPAPSASPPAPAPPAPAEPPR